VSQQATSESKLSVTGGQFDASTDVSQVSVGALVGEVMGDISTLMRKEIELAKAEVRQEATKAGKGAGMLGGAGVAGYFVLLMLSLTLAWGLGEAFDHLWVGGLIVTVLWAIAAGVLFVLGRAQLRKVNPKPEQTVETLKEDVQWAKAQKK